MTGAAVILLGLLVAAVAVVALRHPGKQGSDTAAATSTPSVVRSTSPGGSPSSRASAARSPTQGSPSQGSPSQGSPSQGSSPTHVSSPTTDARTGSSVRSVPLIVLNNTTISGLAAQAATRFEQGGWTVTRYGNLTNDIASTCAYYDPSVSGARDAALALQKQYPTIKRVKVKFSGLPAGPIVVVLTPDYSSS